MLSRGPLRGAPGATDGSMRSCEQSFFGFFPRGGLFTGGIKRERHYTGTQEFEVSKLFFFPELLQQIRQTGQTQARAVERARGGAMKWLQLWLLGKYSNEIMWKPEEWLTNGHKSDFICLLFCDCVKQKTPPPPPPPGSRGNDCGGTRLKAVVSCLVGLC